MGFWGDFFKAAGESMNEMAWKMTLEQDGLAELQIKIRKFLREATPEERDKRMDSLRSRHGYARTPEDMQLWIRVAEVYEDELNRLESGR
jgi:hypothetical protein